MWISGQALEVDIAFEEAEQDLYRLFGHLSGFFEAVSQACPERIVAFRVHCDSDGFATGGDQV